MTLIDRETAMHHWLATATALYDPTDLAAGVRIYRDGHVARVVPFSEDMVAMGPPPPSTTLGVVCEGVGWIAALPCPGFRVPQVDTHP